MGIDVQRMAVGDMLLLAAGAAEKATRITGIERLDLQRPVPVYNLALPDPHTYYANGCVVHNVSGNDEPQRMGIAAGGKMKQTIYQDQKPVEAYDFSRSCRLFVNICNTV